MEGGGQAAHTVFHAGGTACAKTGQQERSLESFRELKEVPRGHQSLSTARWSLVRGGFTCLVQRADFPEIIKS